MIFSFLDMNNVEEKPFSPARELTQPLRNKSKIKRRLQNIVVLGAIALEIFSPTTVRAGGIDLDLLPGECADFGVNDLSKRSIRVCNTSDSNPPESETDTLLDSSGKPLRPVIPENYGVNTNFIWESDVIYVPINGVLVAIPYNFHEVLNVKS